jgi:hypothetical protein
MVQYRDPVALQRLQVAGHARQQNPKSDRDREIDAGGVG